MVTLEALVPMRRPANAPATWGAPSTPERPSTHRFRLSLRCNDQTLNNVPRLTRDDEEMNETGKSDLSELLAGMEPDLDEREFVYCNVPADAVRKLDVDPLGRFREEEGETLILSRSEAEGNNIPFTFRCRKITLRIRSSLDAIGFLAAIATELANHGISSNCVSAYHHDHLFVPAHEGERALVILRQLQRASIERHVASKAAADAPYAIRELKISDYGVVRSLLDATPGLSLRSADSREATKRYLARNPGLSFVALAGGRLVGCVMCGHDGRRG
jgi:uncharacterized protein